MNDDAGIGTREPDCALLRWISIGNQKTMCLTRSFAQRRQVVRATGQKVFQKLGRLLHFTECFEVTDQRLMFPLDQAKEPRVEDCRVRAFLKRLLYRNRSRCAGQIDCRWGAESTVELTYDRVEFRRRCLREIV